MGARPLDVWLAAGLRTPFARVDAAFAERDALGLSVPVAQAMAAHARGAIDLASWGAVIVNLAYNNLAREVWLDAKLDPRVPTYTTSMQCSSSMAGAFEVAGMLGSGVELAIAGGVESMSGVQIGLGPGLSQWLRRITQARDWSRRLQIATELRLADLELYVPQIKNRATGKSMGEHCEEMVTAWEIAREEQDMLALASHRGAVAGWDTGFFADLVTPLDGVTKDDFPRRETSLSQLARLKPVFDRSEQGTITAGNSSPLTDGAAGVWIGTPVGMDRLPSTVPRVRLVDYELAAVDVFTEGLLMAPVTAIPRLLARHGLRYEDVALWEIHEAFTGQLACHLKALGDRAFVLEKARVPHTFGDFPRDRVNPNGGSVALGHPFAATGARILSQAVKELAAMPAGSRAVVSICADGGQGTVALLQH